jgi:hypothetical protein
MTMQLIQKIKSIFGGTRKQSPPMQKFDLPASAEFQVKDGPKADWLEFDPVLIALGATERDTWGFYNRMLELAGHKSYGSVPDDSVRAESYSLLIRTWNSFNDTPTPAEYEAALLKILGRS